MSDETEKKPKKKGKGILMKVVGGVVLLGAGGGGVFGLMQAGIIGSHAEAKEDNTPKLVRKGDEDPYAQKKEGEGEGGGEPVYGEGGSEYRTSYYTFDGDFTSNLKGSDSLIQVSLAASTRRDGRVLMWLKEHELAIRSAMLNVLADTSEEEVSSIDGKERLQKRLTASINHVLEEEEGFGGIDDVFFRSFIIQ
ncbi:flagellar FliL protein [Novosphingobium fluoreni]|uniref:Flagellar protein FliL n=1 Tax=Novosphingobium fluoreni TaxID=1391222 RepID=A0A7W6FWT1_9SPHN|nr:flagellar basal body-associated FliL family protein [Novosphingobium fluoreni]MBB3938553.1 flagellar FliL protein [Novosphingobium fluoreni]